MKMPDSTSYPSTDFFFFHSLRFLFSAKVQTGSGVHSHLYPVVIKALSREQSGRNVMLIADLHLAQRLRMSGAIPPAPVLCLHGLVRNNFTETHMVLP
jgi:hypothetical protein